MCDGDLERCSLPESTPVSDFLDVLGELGALPTLFFLPPELKLSRFGARLFSVDIELGPRLPDEPGNDLSSSRGDKLGLKVETGTFAKCSIGILI